MERILNYYEVNGIKRYVTPYVAKYLQEIVATARECKITELYLFGSSTNFDFKFWCSDLDFACDGTDMQRYEFSTKLRKIQEYLVDVIAIEDAKRNKYFYGSAKRGVRLL